MSEPMVCIPVRVALFAAKKLNLLSGVSVIVKGRFPLNGAIAGEIVDAITDQCSMEEIDIAAVALKIQGSA